MCQSWCCINMKSPQLTALRPADVSHSFWSAFDEDVTVFSSKMPHNDAGSSQLRDKLKGLEDAELDGFLARFGQFAFLVRCVHQLLTSGGEAIEGERPPDSSSSPSMMLCFPSSKDQPVNSNILRSSGSPTSSPSTERREWQVAMA